MYSTSLSCWYRVNMGFTRTRKYFCHDKYSSLVCNSKLNLFMQHSGPQNGMRVYLSKLYSSSPSSFGKCCELDSYGECILVRASELIITELGISSPPALALFPGLLYGKAWERGWSVYLTRGCGLQNGVRVYLSRTINCI